MYLKILGSLTLIFVALMSFAQQTTGVLLTQKMSEKDELRKLYDSLNGSQWKKKWNLNLPIDQWHGVTTTAALGVVDIIDLDGMPPTGYNDAITGGNGLKGHLPRLNFENLRILCLSENPGLTGLLPDLSGMTALQSLYIDDCKFDGFSDNTFDDLRTIERLFLQRNNFKGVLPASLEENKPVLQSLLVRGNQFYGKIPISRNLSNLDIRDNRYTFKDIAEVWNRKKEEIKRGTFAFFYEDQKDIPMPDTIRAPIGFPLVLDVKVDSGVLYTKFRWFKNNDTTAIDTIEANSQFLFRSISAQDAGAYRCIIEHDSLTRLKLRSENVQLVVCTPTIVSLTGLQCPDYSRTFETTTFNVLHPHDTIVLSRPAPNGCDSIVTADLQFQYVQKIRRTICPDTFYALGNVRLNTTGVHQVYVPQTSGQCKDSLYIVDLKVEELPEANAGQDQAICDQVLTLRGTTPPGTQGEWQDDTGMPLGNNITLRSFKPGLNRFNWILSTSTCPAYSKDELQVRYEMAPRLKADTFKITEGTSGAFDPITKDTIMNREWSLSWINAPQVGKFQPNPDGTFRYTADKGQPQTLVFGYRICSQACPNNCTETQIRMKIEPEKNLNGCYDVITPNGDGYNDTLVIPLLEGKAKDEYKQNEFIVVNAQNQVVFRQAPYDNTWGGQGLKNEMLPLGTYNYKFIAKGLKEPITCSVLIIK